MDDAPSGWASGPANSFIRMPASLTSRSGTETLAGPGPAPNASGSWAAAGDPGIRAIAPRRTSAFFLITIDKRPAEELETDTKRPSAETVSRSRLGQFCGDSERSYTAARRPSDGTITRLSLPSADRWMSAAIVSNGSRLHGCNAHHRRVAPDARAIECVRSRLDAEFFAGPRRRREGATGSVGDVKLDCGAEVSLARQR